MGVLLTLCGADGGRFVVALVVCRVEAGFETAHAAPSRRSAGKIINHFFISPGTVMNLVL